MSETRSRSISNGQDERISVSVIKICPWTASILINECDCEGLQIITFLF